MDSTRELDACRETLRREVKAKDDGTCATQEKNSGHVRGEREPMEQHQPSMEKHPVSN
jgi:hypothetical protein